MHRAHARSGTSVYSAPQAGRGESSYVKTCARCHGASLGGGDEATPLAGSAFLGNWNGQAVSDLQKRIIETMPSDSVGIYDRKLVDGRHRVYAEGERLSGRRGRAVRRAGFAQGDNDLDGKENEVASGDRRRAIGVASLRIAHRPSPIADSASAARAA